MTHPSASMEPPRWPRALLRFVLPCDPMRDAIFGDLHEEFTRDAEQLGVRRARARYVSQTAGIITHALADALRWRSWVSTAPAMEPITPTSSGRAANGALVHESLRARAAGVGRHAGLAVVAIGVLVAGIVVNTVLFSAVKDAARPLGGESALLSSAMGAGAVVLLLLCAGVAAAVLCAGPRWLYARSRRRQATS